MGLFEMLTGGAIIARTSLNVFERPDRLPRAMLAMAPWGPSLGAVIAGAATRTPQRVAVRDEHRSVSYRTLWTRSRRIAAELERRGIGPGTCIGLLGRNHVGFVEGLIAASLTGADIVLLNTGFAAPQLADVVEHEDVGLVIHDDEFADTVATCGAETFDEHELSLAAGSGQLVGPRRHQGRVVVLTSGTTGRPKGAARRSDVGAIAGVAALYERIPFRHGDTQVIAAPCFHSWGLTNLLLGFGRGTTNVIARRFDAEQTLRAVSDHRARVLVVVPVMLSRLLALPTELIDDAVLTDLEVIASSGSALGGELTTAVLDRFGPVLYNLYGSTEVAVATIATPADLGRAPTTAGRRAFAVHVEILDDDGDPVPDGDVGRIFVGGPMPFDGYTGGGGKEEQHGLLSSGDLGYFRDGLLFVVGREDDMIVSGGENVFPSEVEEAVHGLAGVDDVAVVGVDDDEFGQVLAAFVVPDSGSDLTADDVRSHVRDRLARHKVPRHVVMLDELPRNASGKVLRNRLSDGLT